MCIIHPMSEEQTPKAPRSGSNYLTPMAILMAGILIAVAVVVKDNPQILGLKSPEPQTTETAVAQNPAPSAPKPLPALFADVDLGTSAIEGNKDAPVTIVEVSDYECPYCKRHALTGAGPEIKSKYIDTGQIKLAFINYPLSFHDPAATKEAETAECVRAQGGDAAFFKFYTKLFETSAGNGAGIEDVKLYDLATQVGVNSTAVKSCVTAGTKKESVAEDLAKINTIDQNLRTQVADLIAKGEVDSSWADQVGIGTPTFFVGKSSDTGTIKGEWISGAQPISEFDKVIEKYL